MSLLYSKDDGRRRPPGKTHHSRCSRGKKKARKTSGHRLAPQRGKHRNQSGATFMGLGKAKSCCRSGKITHSRRRVTFLERGPGGG